jgi:hypothetical protein
MAGAEDAGNDTVPKHDEESAREAAGRRLRGKNVALALALVAWVALIWVITMVNFDAGV